MRITSLLTPLRTGMFVTCLAAAPASAEQQQPDAPASPQPPSATPMTLFPRLPPGTTFPGIPQTRQSPLFPPFTALAPRVHFESAPAKPAGPRVVCGMLVVPANADLD